MTDRDTRLAEAARWFAARRRNIMTIEEREEFERWSSDAENREALRLAERAWATSAALMPKMPVFSPAPVYQPGRRRFLKAASVALAVAGLGGAGFVWQRRERAERWDGEAATGVGEQREITLADGSRVQLNVTSKIRWRVSDGERIVALDDGDAMFMVSRDPARPFSVRMGTGQVRVLGTVFSVRLRGDSSLVEVREGHVAVTPRPPEGMAARTVHLTAGQTLRFDPRQIGGIASVPPEQVGEWRDHLLTFQNAKLGEVVDELGRNFPAAIRLEPAALADRRVTLRLRLSDQDTTFTLLSKLLGLKMQKNSETEISIYN